MPKFFTRRRTACFWLIFCLLGIGQGAQGMLWKGRRQSTNIEDRRHDNAPPLTIDGIQIPEIIKAWKTARQELRYVGIAAEKSLGAFSTCPKLNRYRMLYVRLKKDLSSAELDGSVKAIEELPANLSMDPKITEGADSCEGGFNSASAQLALQKQKIFSAKSYYVEKSQDAKNTILSIDHVFASRTRMQSINEPGNCSQYTYTISQKIRMFATAHKALLAKLNWYSQKITEQQTQIAKAAKSCGSVGPMK